jgi:hypothetical protein
VPLPDKGAGGVPLPDNRRMCQHCYTNLLNTDFKFLKISWKTVDLEGIVRLYRIIGACAFKMHLSLQFSMKKSTNPLIGACAYMRGIRVPFGHPSTYVIAGFSPIGHLVYHQASLFINMEGIQYRVWLHSKKWAISYVPNRDNNNLKQISSKNNENCYFYC